MEVQGGRQRLLLYKLNEQLTCKLCGGYFVDATTITECLHSFCRSCIVKYLENSKYCPICEVQVHKSKPLLNIRPDHTLQDIVYKLVPGCYQNEMRSRREFFANHPEVKTATISPESKGEPVESYIYSPDESLSLSLEYYNPNSKTDSDDNDDVEFETKTASLPRRYLRCPAAVTIFHLQKLIRAKYGLTDTHRIDILYKEEPLSSTYTLMDVMYIYHWKRKVPLHLSYRIFESSSKRIKLSEDNAKFKKSLSDSGISQIDSQDDQPHKEWKEVQLKISETGVMSVTDITSPDSKKNIRTLELDERGKTDLNSIIDIKSSKELSEEDLKPSIEILKEKLKVKKEETEGTVTRSAMKLHALKAEEAKIKNEEKSTSLKMDTRASVKEANKSDKNIKETKNDSQILTNNNSISSEKEVENKNQKTQAKSTAAGSKINALSAKLQFQPKVGPINNTYSKKVNTNDKKTVTSNLKSSDSKMSKNVNKVEKNKELSQKSLKTECKINPVDQVVQTPIIASVTVTVSSSVSKSETTNFTNATSSSTTSMATVKVTSTSPSKAHDASKTLIVKTQSVGLAETIKNTNITTSSIASTMQTSLTSTVVSDSKTIKSNDSVKTQPTFKIQTLSQKNETKPPTSMQSIISSENSSGSAISYSVKDMVNKRTSSPTQKNITSLSYSKSPISTSTTLTSNAILSLFGVQTSGMSIYPISTKSSSYTNCSNAATTNTIATATLITTPTIKTESKSESIPPCPDAIPLSMMKSTARKNQLLTKNTCSLESSTKSTPGSKIDDICAKIGENSKEKNKMENRGKSDIPGLLEIPKKNPSTEQVLKTIPSIHVPIFKPSNKETTINENYKILPSVSTHSHQSSVSGVTQKVPSSKKRVPAFSYKTLRNPPRTWNPTLSKNNYVAIKNQEKELQQQGYSCDAKQIQSKPSKIFTMRNTPRYLGNPASGVKPMFGVSDETCKEKDQTPIVSGSSKSHTVNMTKIDPQTLQPIVSMVSSPPYSSNERTYQSGPFSNRDIRSTSSPVSPRNSPVNMFSTSPFIPSPTPNTNPRLIYSTFPTFSNANRFPHSMIPHSPLGLPPPLSAFHSSLPQVKFYQRSSYTPQTGAYGTVTQPPTVQRIPPTSHPTSPKSPKTSVESKISTTSSNDIKQDEVQRIPKVTLSRKVDTKAFNLAKPECSEAKQQSKLDFLAKISAAASIDRAKISPVSKHAIEKKDNKMEMKVKVKVEDGKEEKKNGSEGKDDSRETRFNGDLTEIVSKSSDNKSEIKFHNDKVLEDKSSKSDTANGVSQNITDKLETDCIRRKSPEQAQLKKVDLQRNKAES